MPLTFTNGILPLALLIALAVGLPMVLAGRTLSQRRLAVAMLVTTLLVWIGGAVLMAWSYYQANGRLDAGYASYFQRALPLGLLYAPILTLVWLVRAQAVERRRGLQMRDRG
ncbi:MAG: hypothetical protein H7317_10450 [Pseudorhodobacter sp.]|nr:hypothetical protein [Pseudorhodobacter sp.]